jgi:hypothetical protein
MRMHVRIAIGWSVATLAAAAGTAASAASFGEDVAFLRTQTEVLILKDQAGSPATVAVAPAMQARVMASSALGGAGTNAAWIARNRPATPDRAAVYGGADRFWLGPEGGPFSLFHVPGAPLDAAHGSTPWALESGTWASTHGHAPFGACFDATLSVTNHSGFVFQVGVWRAVRVLSRRAVQRNLGMALATNVNVVGFETENTIRNLGATAWTQPNGLLTVRGVGAFATSPRTVIVVPFKTGPESELGPVLAEDAFGRPPPGRVKVDDRGVVFFAADGAVRSGFSVPAPRARRLLAAYDADSGALTVVKVWLPRMAVATSAGSGAKPPNDPFGADGVACRCDGPPAAGGAKGAFYELETSSPPAALQPSRTPTQAHGAYAPGETLTHLRRTIRLEGPRTELDSVARALLGVGLDDIAAAF